MVLWQIQPESPLWWLESSETLERTSNYLIFCLGIITNISYAHSKNFKNIKQIANAKAEIMNNIKSNGTIILNNGDDFFNYHKKFALKKKLKVISFGIKNQSLI